MSTPTREEANDNNHETLYQVTTEPRRSTKARSAPEWYGNLIRPFCIMLLYQYLLHFGLLLHIISQYLWLFSLILKVYHEEGDADS